MIKREVVYPILLIFVAVILIAVFRLIGVTMTPKADDGGISASPAIELETNNR